MSASRSAPRAPSAVVLTLARLFDATPEAVFDAWLDGATLGRWLLAPPGGGTLRASVDPCVGGGFTLAGDGATPVRHHGRYLQILRPRRLVFSLASGRAAQPGLVRVELEPAPSGGARLVLTHAMDPEWAAFAPGMRTRWAAMLDGLAEIVSGPRELALTRRFAAPRALLWRAWTDAAMLARWLGPNGYVATEVRCDPRPGGAWRILLTRPESGETFLEYGRYEEVAAPERLVLTCRWRRDGGEESPETRITVTLAEEAGGTRMEFRQAVFDTAAIAEAFGAGWSTAFALLREGIAAARIA